MKKSQRMQPIRKVAVSKEQQAASALGEAQNQLQMQLQRLQELRDYQKDYASQFQQTGANGMDVASLMSFRSFLQQLEQAIEQQKQAVDAANALVDQRKKSWLASRGQVKIYDNVISRYHQEEIQQQDKKEQKESDDRAQRPARS
ncbi:flagellar export protein FliJ [Kaarinaea lacus]